jgi:hypothetical protein
MKGEVALLADLPAHSVDRRISRKFKPAQR